MWYVPTSYTFIALRGLKCCSVVGYNVLNTVSKFGRSSTYRLRDIPPLSGMKYCTNSKKSKSYRNEGGLIQQVTRGYMSSHFTLFDLKNPPSLRYGRPFLLYLIKLIIWLCIPQRGGIYTTLSGQIVRYFIVWNFIVDQSHKTAPDHTLTIGNNMGTFKLLIYRNEGGYLPTS